MDSDDCSIEIIILCVVIGLLFLCIRIKTSTKWEQFKINTSYFKVKPKNTPFGKQFNIDDQCNQGMQKNPFYI